MQHSAKDGKVAAAGDEVIMGLPAAKDGGKLENMLDNFSDDGGIVQGAEESFDFNPPEAVSAHAAATGFDAEFTESVVHENKASAPQAQEERKGAPRVNEMAASSRALLSGLGNSFDVKSTK